MRTFLDRKAVLPVFVLLALTCLASCGGGDNPPGYCKGPDFQGGGFQFMLQSCQGSSTAGGILCDQIEQFWNKDDPIEFGPIPLTAWNALPAALTITQEEIEYLQQPFHAVQNQYADEIQVTSSENMYFRTGDVPILGKLKITASLQYINLCPTSPTQIEGTAKVTIVKVEPFFDRVAGTVLDNVRFVAEQK